MNDPLAFRLLALTVGILLNTNVVRSELPPLIPRELLFGNPERASPGRGLTPTMSGKCG
jgi:hypothetical protein